MPFTFSHPAYAFPLKCMSKKLSLTGLILGSMAPDFEYFIMLEPHRSIGHSILGLLLHAIPLSIVLAFAFHYIVKEQLAIHLPKLLDMDRRVYNSWSEWGLRNIKDWFFFIFSVVIGFVSHIVIDGFTHAHGYFVVLFPLLNDLSIFNFPLYKLLQYGLSVFGLLMLIGVVIYKLSRSNTFTREIPPVAKAQKIFYWSSAATFSIALTSVKLLFTSSSNIIGIVVVAPITGAILGVICVSFFTKFVRLSFW